MSGLATATAVGASLGGLVWLCARDPKRRRAFGRRGPGAGAPRGAWALVLLPGVLVPFASGGAGLVVWLGATTVIAWALIAVPPGRWPDLAGLRSRAEDWAGRLARAAEAARAGAAARIAARPRRKAAPSALEAMAARIAALEAEVAALRAQVAGRGAEAAAGAEGVLVELAGHRRH